MTPQLPMSHTEAEIFTFAREWVARCREDDFLNPAPLNPEAGRALLRGLLKQWALSHPFQMDQVVANAEAGWDDADIALRELIAEHNQRFEPLPAVLAAYNVRRLNPYNAPPKKPHGKKKAGNVLKDIAIVTLIMELIERFPASGLLPTRSQLGRKRQHSYCSIVAVVMAEASLHRGGEAAIQQIWRRYKSAILPGTVAEALLLA